MANRSVSIWRYAKIDGKWKYLKPTSGKNNKIKPEDGGYYIRWYEGKKAVWQKCRSAADAVIARDRQQAFLNAHAYGLMPQPKAESPKLVREVLSVWLEEYRLAHQEESYSLMQHTLHEFFGRWDERGAYQRGFCSAALVDQVRRVDLLRFRAYCIDKLHNSERTASNKMLRVNQFVRGVLGLPEGKGPVTIKDGKFTELEPTVYSDDELIEIFKACTPFQFAVFQCYLRSGLRKQELENLEWSDVDLKAGTLTVSPKPDFTPKTHEQRTIEIDDTLVNILKELKHRGNYVFANSNGNRYTHSWDDAKKIGEKAKVADVHPHKFRSSYATRLLQDGVDLKSVQKLLGHSSLESTMRYLAKAESKKLRLKVNAVKFGV